MTKGASFSRLKSRVHLFKYIPLTPKKYGPLWKIKSMYFLCSKRKAYKSFPEKKWFKETLLRGFQNFSRQVATILGEGQIPVNQPIKPQFARASAFFMVKEVGSEILGISSIFLKNLEG
jgi:hypothetical protein